MIDIEIIFEYYNDKNFYFIYVEKLENLPENMYHTKEITKEYAIAAAQKAKEYGNVAVEKLNDAGYKVKDYVDHATDKAKDYVHYAADKARHYTDTTIDKLQRASIRTKERVDDIADSVIHKAKSIGYKMKEDAKDIVTYNY